MKRILTVLILLIGFMQAHAASERNVPSKLKSEGLVFMENKGQVVDNLGNQRPDILYTAHHQGVQVYFRQNALSYVFPQVGQQNGESVVTNVYRTDVEFVGANPQPEVVSEGASGVITNFYLSNSNLNGVQARSYRKLTYRNLYEGIDLVFFATDQNGQSALKYEFVVRPGANPNVIRMRQVAAQKVNITRDGNLVVSNPLGQIEEVAPFTFQTINGTQQVVASAYEVKNGVVSFRLGQYNANETLIIDPLTRQWATNVGGNASDRFNSVTTDANGVATAVGQTNSVNFPVNVGPSKVVDNTQDVVIARFNSNGNLVWATYYGGNGSDIGFGVTQNGNAVTIVGSTAATNLPVSVNAFQPTSGGGTDGFVAQFNATTGQFVWGTYAGGPLADQFTGIQAASNGDLFVVGRVQSQGLATIGQTTLAGNRDIWVGRFNSAGTLAWSTYYGGTNDDQATGIALGDNNDVYVVGASASTGLASPGAFQGTNNGLNDALVVKFNSNGVGQWATYYGGAGTDVANGVAFSNGNVFVVGQTTSTAPSFSIPVGSYQTQNGGLTDGFLFALNGANGNRIMATFIGGSGTDIAFGVTTIGNNVYVGGASNSTNFNLINPNAVNLPFQAANAGFLDMFLVKFDATAPNNALWSFIYGAASDDVIRGISSNSNGAITAVGYSNSVNFPVLNRIPQQTTTPGLGNDDATILRFTDDTQTNEPCILIQSVTAGNILCNGGTTTVQVTAFNLLNNDPLSYTLTTTNGTLIGTPNDFGATFTNVPAGPWTLTVTTGAPNCTATRTGVIAQPSAVVGTAQVTNIDCRLGTQGSVMINASGGTGPYTYSFVGPIPTGGNEPPDNFTSQSSYMGLGAGSYRFRVRDANGCTTAANFLTVQSNAPIANVTNQVSPQCAGDNTGSITVSVSGGTGPFQFSLIPDQPNFIALSNPLATSFTYTNLSGGNKLIRVQDANGCLSDVVSTTLATPTPINVNVVAVNPSSCTASNGSLTLNASGGSGMLMYSFDNGQTFGTSNMIMNQGNRVVQYVVRDANNCRVTGTRNLRSADAPNIEGVSLLPPSCFINFNQPDGQIIVAATGALNQPLFFSIQGGAPGTYFGSITGVYTFSDLPAGNYTVAVANDLFGTCSVTRQVTLNAPPLLLVNSVSRTQPTCGPNSVGGSINVVVNPSNAGTPPLTYSIDGGQTFQSSPTFTGLFPRINGFPIVVRDANGCIANGGRVFLFNPSGLGLVSVTGTAPACGQSNGSITVVPFGGTQPRTYRINNGMARTSTATAEVFQNLTEGAYTVRVSDASGCVVEEQVELATLQLSLTSTAVACNVNNGTITANLIGGSGPFEFRITGIPVLAPQTPYGPIVSAASNASTFVFNDLPPGIFTVTVTDLSSNAVCVASRTIELPTVSSQAFFSTLGPPVNSTSCNNPNGQLNVVATPVAPAASVDSYSLIGTTDAGSSVGINQLSGNFTNLAPGRYVVYAITNTQCVLASDPIVISGPTRPVIDSVRVTQATCSGMPASLQIFARGTGTLVYQAAPAVWVNNGTESASSPGFFSSNTFTAAVTQGSFPSASIVVRPEGANLGDCDATPIGLPATLSLTNPSPITVTATSTPVRCPTPNGTITFNMSGGVQPYRIFINDVEASQSPINSNTFTATRLTAGLKVVRVIDAAGNCAASLAVNVGLHAIFDFTVNATPPAACNTLATPTVISLVDPAAGISPVRYFYFSGRSLLGTVAAAPFTYTSSGQFIPGTHEVVAINGDGCEVRKVVNIPNGGNGLTLNSAIIKNPSCPGGNDGRITVTATFPNAGSFIWVFVGPVTGFTPNTTAPGQTITLDLPNCPAGVYTLRFSSSGCNNFEYTLTLVAPTLPTITNVLVQQPVCGTPYRPGSLAILASGGSGQYEFSVDGGNTWQASGLFTNLAVGSYPVGNIQVRDVQLLQNGCANNFVTWSAPVTIQNPSGLDITNVTVPTGCGIGNDAELEVTYTGPSSSLNLPVVFTLNTGQSITRNSIGGTFRFTQLPAGSYTVTARDALGCEDRFSATIVPLQITVNSAIDPTTCDVVNQNGSIQYSVSGGVSPQSRLVSNGVAPNLWTTANPVTVNNLSNGIHIIEARSGTNNNCIVRQTVLLNDPSGVTYRDQLVQPANSPDCDNGFALARFNLGIASVISYQISSDNGLTWLTNTIPTRNFFTALPAGTYYIRVNTITGSNQCRTYSPAIVVGCTSTRDAQVAASAQDALLSVYPNPTNGQFTVNYTTTKATTVDLKVVDLTGKTILSTTRDLNVGENLLDLNIDNAAAGIYLLQVIDGSEMRTVKVAKN